MTDTPATTMPRREVLLLGDDGRMTSLLATKVPDRTVIAQTDVMAGIARLADDHVDTVLLNVERLNSKTAQAVHAMRQVHPQTRILLYGEAYVEGYAHKAIECGAEDFLVWPIPPSELRNRLGGVLPRRPLRRLSGDFFKQDVASAPALGFLMQFFHDLAQSVPLGRMALVHQAQAILPTLLGASQVTITLEESLTELTTQENGRMVDLPGVRQREGIMVIESNQVEHVLLTETARCLGTMLSLARRDERLKQLATIDELTGAYNRRYFEHFTRQVLRLSQKERTEAALLVFDIDEFKHFNDSY
ncbi:MAG: diguanylate cyclase, partial [Sedimentisphaerales bacterium]|nr:diguanylate cyclase [Sedimentisphaerales bacterium]